MATAQETFLTDFVAYLQWKLAGSDPKTKPTEPTVSFKALLKVLPGNDAMREILLKRMQDLQESRGPGDIPPNT